MQEKEMTEQDEVVPEHVDITRTDTVDIDNYHGLNMEAVLVILV
jgi:hypothetical protein